jgi:phosphatase NudJ
MGFYIGCGMVLAHGDKFILVQETSGTAKQGLFSLPAGTLELDEDIIACIKREVWEETGASVEPEGFIGIYQLVMEAEHNNVLFCVFTGTLPPGTMFHSDEHEVIKAFTYDEIVALDMAGKLRAPTILSAIDAYNSGKVLPLSLIRASHIETLPSIVVDRAGEV